eukprot:TRINITY_DN2312_c0_g1_i2.p1 TRINITY_DN2312_c0_g1~~TRINITY_DN2312_c0_g1_i2.p1  ORF type:complete len:687 (+),score=148.91 TRINITY_DN2312_c0_g1_i2:1201-3261(+)
MEDSKLISLEKKIFELQKHLTTVETDLMKKHNDISTEIKSYAEDNQKTFKASLKQWSVEEKELQDMFYYSYDELFQLRRSWRKRVIKKFRENEGKKHKGEDLSTSKIFFQIYEKTHPAYAGTTVLRSTSSSYSQNSSFSSSYTPNASPASPRLNGSGSFAPNLDGFGSFDLSIHEIMVGQDQKLGEGAFGTVYKGLCRGKEVAVKVLKKLQIDSKIVNEFLRECTIMRSLPHPNILLFQGACLVPGHYKLVTELAMNGSLDKVLSNKNTKISFNRKMKFARQIAEGVNWLHKQSPPLLHLDLKPANILLTSDWTVKIADFGMSRLKIAFSDKDELDDTDDNEKSRTGIGGTPLYMPGEMFDVKPNPTEKCDVYAYGIILWEVLTERTPYDNQFKNFTQLISAVRQGCRPELPPSTPPSFADLIRRCWSEDPNKRPTFSSILNSDVFNKTISEAISDGQERASEIWNSFGLKDGKVMEEVDWNTFKDTFCKKMQIDNPESRKQDLDALRALLNVDDNKCVTVSNFQQFVMWFKPFRPSVNGGPSTLDEVSELIRSKWFFGKIDKFQAENLLKGSKSGVFLVRQSSQDGYYTVSYLITDKKKSKLPIPLHTRLPMDDRPLCEKVKECTKKYHLNKVLSERPAKYSVIFPKKSTYVPVDQRAAIDVYKATDDDLLEGEDFAWGDETVVY